MTCSGNIDPMSVYCMCFMFQVALNFIGLNLTILYSCSAQPGFHRYFKYLDPIFFWEPYCKSDQFAVRYHSKVIAGQIFHYLPGMEASIVQLDKRDVDIIIGCLSEASSSDKHEVSKLGCRFSTQELLLGVSCLLCDAMNSERMINGDILTTLMSLLVSGSLVEKREALLIVWKLAKFPLFTEVLNSLDLPFIDILTELESCEGADLQLLISGVLSCVDENSKSRSIVYCAIPFEIPLVVNTFCTKASVSTPTGYPTLSSYPN